MAEYTFDISTPEAKALIAQADAVPSNAQQLKKLHKDFRLLERTLQYAKSLRDAPDSVSDSMSEKFRAEEIPQTIRILASFPYKVLKDHVIRHLPVAEWIYKGENKDKLPTNPRLSMLDSILSNAIHADDRETVMWVIEEARKADRGEDSLLTGTSLLGLSRHHSARPYHGFEDYFFNNHDLCHTAANSGNRELATELMELAVGNHMAHGMSRHEALCETFFWGEKNEYSPFGNIRSAAALEHCLSVLRQIHTDEQGVFDEAAYYAMLQGILTDTRKNGSVPTPYSLIHTAAIGNHTRTTHKTTGEEKEADDALLEGWIDVLKQLDAHYGLTGKESHLYRALSHKWQDGKPLFADAASYGYVDRTQRILDVLSSFMNAEELKTHIGEYVFGTTDKWYYYKKGEWSYYHLRSLPSYQEKRSTASDYLISLAEHYDVTPPKDYTSPETFMDHLAGRAKFYDKMLKKDSLDPSLFNNHQKRETVEDAIWRFKMIEEYATAHQDELSETVEEYRQRYICNMLESSLNDFGYTVHSDVLSYALDQLATLPQERQDDTVRTVFNGMSLYKFGEIASRGAYHPLIRLMKRIEALPDFEEIENGVLEKVVNEMNPDNPSIPFLSAHVLKEEYGLSLWHLGFYELADIYSDDGPGNRDGSYADYLKCLNLMHRYKLSEEVEAKLRKHFGFKPYHEDDSKKFDGYFVSHNTWKKVCSAVPMSDIYPIERYHLSNEEIDARYGLEDHWPDAPCKELVRYYPLTAEQMKVYERILPLMKEIRERERNGEVEVHAYKLAYLFNDFNQAAKYVEQHAKESANPIHDLLLYEFPKLPPSETTWQRDIWAQRIVKYGQGFSGSLQRAAEVEQNLREQIRAENPEISLKAEMKLLRERLSRLTPKELKDIIRSITYNALDGFIPDPEVAEYLMRNGIDQIGYERTASIIGMIFEDLAQKKPKDRTPDIAIDGASLVDDQGNALNGFKLSKVATIGVEDEKQLQLNIARCLWIGFEVNCCNHLDGETRKLAMAQATSPTTSLYVIKKHLSDGREKVVAKLSGFLDKSGTVFVFNSWERLGVEQDRLAEPFLHEAACQVMAQNPNISEVRIGRPRSEGRYHEAKRPVEPANPQAVAADSSGQQFIVLDRETYLAEQQEGSFAAKHPKRTPLVADGTGFSRSSSSF